LTIDLTVSRRDILQTLPSFQYGLSSQERGRRIRSADEDVPLTRTDIVPINRCRVTQDLRQRTLEGNGRIQVLRRIAPKLQNEYVVHSCVSAWRACSGSMPRDT